MRVVAISVFLATVGGPAGATILQRLTLDDMARNSTSVVRARVKNSRAVIRGGDVFTLYGFATLENLKSGPSATEVAVPGGVAGGIRQLVDGAPALLTNREYVLFLWTGPSGLTQLTGLSQGLFRVERSSGGGVRALRAAAGEQMLDSAGRTVRDESISMPLTELRAEISKAIAMPVTHRMALRAQAAK